MKAALLTQTEMALSHTPREYTGMKHRLTWLTNNNHINLKTIVVAIKLNMNK